MGDIAELAKYIGGAGGGAAFAAGIWFAVKYLRAGRNGSRPDCPGKPYFEENKVEHMRQAEAFRNMMISWDRSYDVIVEQTKAIRELGDKTHDALLTMASRMVELVEDRRVSR